jgi:hypothetical protein
LGGELGSGLGGLCGGLGCELFVFCSLVNERYLGCCRLSNSCLKTFNKEGGQWWQNGRKQLQRRQELPLLLLLTLQEGLLMLSDLLLLLLLEPLLQLQILSQLVMVQMLPQLVMVQMLLQLVILELLPELQRLLLDELLTGLQ